jgi:hypothetical protein
VCDATRLCGRFVITMFDIHDVKKLKTFPSYDFIAGFFCFIWVVFCFATIMVTIGCHTRSFDVSSWTGYAGSVVSLEKVSSSFLVGIE